MVELGFEPRQQNLAPDFKNKNYIKIVVKYT